MAVDLAKDVVRDGHPYSTDSTWENVCQGIVMLSVQLNVCL